MSLIALAAALALSLVDPTGDAAGDGTLEPPTSPVYANAALFDLQELSLTEGPSAAEAATLRVAMGAVEVDDTQPAGFNRAVVDVYLDFAEGGADATLSGPGMLMPQGRGWDYAVRVSPRGAFGAPAPLDDDQAVEWAPLELALDGDVFVVSLPAGIPTEVDAYAVSGVYDAFSRDSWRQLTSSPSPWSYSGTEQVVPVIDVFAADHDTQMRALRDGVLPAPSRQAADGLPWLLLSMAGVLIAATGLWLRRLVGRSADEGPAVVASASEDAPALDEPDTVPETDEPVPDPESDAVPLDSEPEGGDASLELPADDISLELEPEDVSLEAEAEEVSLESGAEDVSLEPEPEDLSPEPMPETAVVPIEEDVERYVGAPESDAADRDGEEPDEDDPFGKVGRELSDAEEEEEDDLLGFVGRRGRSLRVENSEDDTGSEGS